MYKYFCKVGLGLKFGEFYFGFTGYNMPGFALPIAIFANCDENKIFAKKI